MLYIPEHFELQELVPRHVYQDRGMQGWELLDPLLLETIDVIRNQFGPAIINNWATGGNREWSGLRTQESPYGSQYSQHRFGRAADMLFSNVTVHEAREYIIANPDRFPLITGIEKDVDWLHIDVRNTLGVKIF